MTNILVIAHHLFLLSATNCLSIVVYCCVCQVVQGFPAHSCLPFSFSADRLVQCLICFCEFVVGVLIGS